MLTTKHFVFIHVQKTGGKFIKNVCRDHLPADWFIPNSNSDHGGITSIPPECRDLPIFASIRNPWDWHVSWYHFTKQRERWPADYEEDSDWRWAFDSGHASFKQAVSALCGVPIPSSERAGPAKEPRWVDRMRRHDWDLYSHWCWILLRDWPDTGRIEMGRYEQLADTFLDFLRRHEIPTGPEFETALRTAPRVNTSERGPYRPYYDEELKELVRYKCRGIVERYGYEF